MSQYVDFYLKSNSDEFLPIGDYGRSSMIYKYICDYVPYEKITPITTNTINEIISNINSDISDYKEKMSAESQKISAICSFNNSAGEKLGAIHDVSEIIHEYQEEIDDCNFAVSFFRILLDMMDSARYSENNKYSPDEYLYAGIEIGEPTIDDIQKTE